MARSNGAMAVSVMMMMMIMGAAAQAPAPSVDCQTVVLTLSDCLGYVTGADKTPPAACCTELSSVVKSSPQCLCLLFNTSFTAPLGVNVTIAQQLPAACKVQTPPTSLCASVGVPVPGPVSSSSPVVAPSPAKTPAKSPAKTPASSKAPTPATSPTASSPLSSPSTSPTSPTPTMASSPSPTTTTPTVPAGSPPTPESTTPSPNSAPAIISRNAAVAASLLLLASIFLS